MAKEQLESLKTIGHLEVIVDNVLPHSRAFRNLSQSGKGVFRDGILGLLEGAVGEFAARKNSVRYREVLDKLDGEKDQQGMGAVTKLKRRLNHEAGMSLAVASRSVNKQFGKCFQIWQVDGESLRDLLRWRVESARKRSIPDWGPLRDWVFTGDENFRDE